MTSARKKLIQTLVPFLPGIFLVGSDTGTGSATGMAAACGLR